MMMIGKERGSREGEDGSLYTCETGLAACVSARREKGGKGEGRVTSCPVLLLVSLCEGVKLRS